MRISSVLLGVILAIGPPVGAALGFLVAPVTHWLLDVIDGAPGPLRLLALIPTPWLVGGGAVAGLLVVMLLVRQILRETTVVDVGADAVTVHRDETSTYVERVRIAAVFVDPHDLVLVGSDERELLRRDADIGSRRLAAAFQAAGYPWAGDRDPQEHRFRPWIDGTPDLPADIHEILRQRGRELRDKNGDKAADLRERLQDLGVIVRDRTARNGQQWRFLTDHDTTRFSKLPKRSTDPKAGKHPSTTTPRSACSPQAGDT
ncbi:YqeB family protein [Actinoalloteichus fjordicus]